MFIIMSIKETHILIDWQCYFDYDFVKEKITNYNLSLSDYTKHNKLIEKKKIMKQFYNVNVDDNRGETEFNIYIIIDENPKYELRPTTKGKRLVNSKLFDLKMFLRKNNSKGNQIHATDNIQETKDNLHALNLFDKYYNQKKFKDINEVFETLNKVSSLKWIIMRNFEEFPDNINIDEHLDIDLLVNDYYLVKAVLDASSATPFKSQYENNGNRILNYVYVNNIKVLFDFRSVGDNYYDINLQNKMIDTRVKHKNFYIPCKDLHLYSLIYHAIIHKIKISNTYKKIFIENGIKKENINRRYLKVMLDEFMLKNNYKYVRPERSVGFHL